MKTCFPHLVGFGVLALSVQACASSGPTLYAAPAWTERGEIGSMRVLMRATPGGLLIRRDAGAIYLYREGAPKLMQVNEADWQQAGTPIVDCDHSGTATAFQYDIDAGTLSLGNRTLDIPGYVVQEAGSPSGRRAVVVTGTGPGKSLLPFFGGGGGSGPYRHNLIALPEAVALAPSVALPFTPKMGAVRACWSRDERYVVYFNLILTHLAVVAVNTKGIEQ